MTTTEAKEPLVDREWTFMHRIKLSTGKPGGAWLDHNGDERYFAHTERRSPIIGGVYTMPCSVDGRQAAVKAAKWTGRRSKDEAAVGRWRLEDEAFEADAKRAARERALTSGDQVTEDIGHLTLAEVARLIARANRHERAGLIAIVLRQVGAA